MIGTSPKNLVAGLVQAAKLGWFLGTAVLVFAGCTEVTLQSPSRDVKAFFMAGNEANFLGLQSLSPSGADLSAYSHLMGVKYPPTLKVDVLSQPPSRPYQSFAVLECEPASYTTSGELMEGFKNKAREIGADAIILYHSMPEQGLAGTPPHLRMRAVAIKYKLNGLSDQKPSSYQKHNS
jgi:hypothetical protein